MPDIEVTIGGRNFLVSCQPGEEHFLRSAAAQLDLEAQPLVASMGRLPEVKMLLMAGLMLADRAAAQEDEMRELRAKLSTLEDRPAPEAQRVEVPVIPPQVPQTFAGLAARVEALAELVDAKAAMAQETGATILTPVATPAEPRSEVPAATPVELPVEDPSDRPFEASPDADPEYQPDGDQTEADR